MKKIQKLTVIALAVVMTIAAAAFAGCNVALLYSYGDTDALRELPYPTPFLLHEEDYRLSQKQVYYPEDADADSAMYVLTYTIPVFDDIHDIGKSMNDRVRIFEAELQKRVEDERLPLADRAEGEPCPYTTVDCSVTQARGFVNILFNETYAFGTTEETIRSTLVLKDGKNVGLAAASGAYDAKERAAQQILNIVMTSNADDTKTVDYYDDLTLDDIISAIDMFNGYYVVEDGYTIMFKSGMLAPSIYGEPTITITTESMYPDAVGDTLSVLDYETLLPVINKLLIAAYSDGTGFVSGQPTEVLQTSFMIQLVSELHEVLDVTYTDDGGIYLDRDTFMSIFHALFDIDFHNADSVMTGRIEADDNGFTVYPNDRFEPYGFALDDAMTDGDVLTLVGEVMYGDLDGNFSSMSSASINLRHDPGSAFGYKFISLEFN